MKQMSFGLPRRTRKAERNKPPFSLRPGIRQAQLSGTPIFDKVTAFARDNWQALESYQPGLLIGHAAELGELAESVRAGLIDLSSVDHAVFALTKCGDSPISDILRVLLWQCFGVPVYELLVTEDSELLAADCEAQEGWHLQPGMEASLLDREIVLRTPGIRALHTGLTAEIEAEGCPCGRITPRIMNVERLRGPAAARRLAAIA
ncbi:MAG TPA: hypothetical protein VLI55_21900 [Bryobacteraceae bacterium]|nr:hypothetical protein [Bryobacteraceae bacterium]